MWRDVLAHAHWTPELAALGASALRRTFGLPPPPPPSPSSSLSSSSSLPSSPLPPSPDTPSDIPPFIALHARHGDFAQYCSGSPPSECFAPLSAFDTRVRELQDELEARTGVRPERVVMTGDEKDETWWEDVAERGWYRLDYAHEKKGEKGEKGYGNWYPVLLDAVVQSMAVGFVGTEESTFSHIARRRVVDWNGGAARMVKWGRPGADAH